MEYASRYFGSTDTASPPVMALSPAPSPLHFSWSGRRISEKPVNAARSAEQEYLRLLSGEGRNVSRLDELRNIIEVRKWQVNQAAGRYVRSHEAVQHISIRDRLNDFMQQHGTALAAALAPELMGYSELTAIARNSAIQRATDALREALLSWLAKGEKINYSAQDSDILTTIGFRPDAASVDDSREKFTPAQNMIFSRKSAELTSRQSV